jgi:hypothetical protein
VRCGSIDTVTVSELDISEIVGAWISCSSVFLKGAWKRVWIVFESNSHLTRIESEALSDSSLQSILIPNNVEILDSNCFSSCKSLSSITFESNSYLTRIKSRAFHESSLQSILIPSTILFIASDAFEITLEIRLIDGDSYPSFTRWLQLNRSGIRVDFRRIERVALSLPCFKDYHLNISEFEERSTIYESRAESNEYMIRLKMNFWLL